MGSEDLPRPALGAAAAASIGAGFLHAAAIGSHTDHEQLAVLFAASAVFQGAWGMVAIWRPSRLLAAVGVIGNAGAFAAWLTSRLNGISFIDGLEQKESAEFFDTVTAGLGLAAAVLALVALLPRRIPARALSLGPAAALAALLAVPALVVSATDPHGGAGHSHGGEEAAAHEHADGEEAAAREHADGEQAAAGAKEPVAHEHADGAEAAAHEHGTDGGGVDADGNAHGTAGHDMSTMWPRPWNPKQPIDLSGVSGVTKQQERFGVALVANTMRDLPDFADTAAATKAGYKSIGDSRTGYEHYINYSMIGDGKFLDSTAPESIVYKVDGDKRTVVSAMYIAEPEYPFGSKKLDKVMGPIVTWHNHDNLCWQVTDDGPKVVAVTDNNGGVCPEGTFHAGAEAAMVHVWIAPHECGVFSALEGHGAGQSFDRGGERVDQCAHGHGDHGGGQPALANWPRPFDPADPIDLSGVEGVTPEQERYGAQLIEEAKAKLPAYADAAVAEADGYRSIHDGGTGFEHLIKWELTEDGKMLDATKPEALVYATAGGKRELVSAMYIAEPEYELGTKELDSMLGPLATWHVHDDLCFAENEAKDGFVVAGITEVGGECDPPLVKLPTFPMVHVWISPHQCGPFAALEGVGAGQASEREAADRVDQCAAHHGH